VTKSMWWLEVPPYQYLSDTRIIVGVDEDNKA
jgi:ubiquinol-cytochrome c reductase iron-sulfur subunit